MFCIFQRKLSIKKMLVTYNVMYSDPKFPQDSKNHTSNSVRALNQKLEQNVQPAFFSYQHSTMYLTRRTDNRIWGAARTERALRAMICSRSGGGGVPFSCQSVGGDTLDHLQTTGNHSISRNLDPKKIQINFRGVFEKKKQHNVSKIWLFTCLKQPLIKQFISLPVMRRFWRVSTTK